MFLKEPDETKYTLHKKRSFPLTLSWRRALSYRNQSIDLLRKSMDWFLYDNNLRHERVKLVNENEWPKFALVIYKNILWSFLHY